MVFVSDQLNSLGRCRNAWRVKPVANVFSKLILLRLHRKVKAVSVSFRSGFCWLGFACILCVSFSFTTFLSSSFLVSLSVDTVSLSKRCWRYQNKTLIWPSAARYRVAHYASARGAETVSWKRMRYSGYTGVLIARFSA